jgi:MSHA pilin protein MshA
MKQVQRGFTLIELVMVIVILGVLAAVAIPKFVDLGDEAKVAALKGIAGAAGSASAINYAACSALNNVPTTGKCVAISTCAGVSALLQGGFAGAVSTAVDPGTTNGTSTVCTITKDGKSDSFTAIAAGN